MPTKKVKPKKEPDDLVVYGNNDFLLINESYSEEERWIKSTRAMFIEDVGCLVLVTTKQRNLNGTFTIVESVTMATMVKIELIDGNQDNGRKLVPMFPVKKVNK